MTQRVDKVTCLITRLADGVDELVVFDHPLAGVQLPAGTSLPGEDPSNAALREGWEETGIPGLAVRARLNELIESVTGSGDGRLAADVVVDDQPFTRGHAATVIDAREDELLVEVVGKRGWIAADAFADEVVRHVLQLESDVSMPSEWWVVTPDGEGLCWRCRWVPLHSELGLVDGQAHWVTDVIDRVAAVATPSAFRWPDHPRCNDTTHLQFWAFPGIERRFVVSWTPVGTPVDDALVRRALVVARDDDGHVLLVSGDGRTMWSFPGGGREPGETIEDTAHREVAEEACATVTDLRLIGYQHVLHLDDENTVVDEEFQARFAAEVEVDPWSPAFETAARRLVRFDEIRAEIGAWWHPGMLEQILAGATSAWAA
jgi:8-oxo-dGTP pyrophosphatase MutT (NUDIX family)